MRSWVGAIELRVKAVAAGVGDAGASVKAVARLFYVSDFETLPFRANSNRV